MRRGKRRKRGTNLKRENELTISFLLICRKPVPAREMMDRFLKRTKHRHKPSTLKMDNDMSEWSTLTFGVTASVLMKREREREREMCLRVRPVADVLSERLSVVLFTATHGEPTSQSERRRLTALISRRQTLTVRGYVARNPNLCNLMDGRSCKCDGLTECWTFIPDGERSRCDGLLLKCRFFCTAKLDINIEARVACSNLLYASRTQEHNCNVSKASG
ncbi:hypothetical protein F2P81_012734 [Scophthalmus maximus]|uniref:Uncharacterized protein n=1 Tax=Scophthalmus maximus TaxID=52904 RepID=A0A6A4SIG9_SCOMX|nr:hypothetical protein F2P81_012734 [Scophthalmus maximus]